MKKICDNVLKLISIVLLLLIPIVPEVVEHQYALTANDIERNWAFMSWLFILPFVSAAAIIFLLRQKLGAKIYNYRILGLHNNTKLTDIFWILKISFWTASLVYMLYCMLHKNLTWHMNFLYFEESLQLIAPAVAVHLVEKVYLWWPVIKEGMKSEHNYALRLLLTGSSILFRGIGARQTAMEKILYSIRTVYYFNLFIGIILDLHWLFSTDPAILYLSICDSFVVRIIYHYVSLSFMRIIELIFVDKD